MSIRRVNDPLLSDLGVQGGHFVLREPGVSSVPQLTYARELLALQRRFGIGYVDRLCLGAPVRQGSRVASRPGVDVAHLHAHDDIELRVLLSGQLRYTLVDESAGRVQVVDVEAGEWLALPPRLSHQVQQRSVRVDGLRLLRRRGGWAPRVVWEEREPLAA